MVSEELNIGLAGFDLGNQLINRVVHELQQQFPNIVNFATLSPIPLFTEWLNSKSDHQFSLDKPTRKGLLEHLPSDFNGSDLDIVLSAVGQDEWYKAEDLSTLLKEPLMKLVAEYLMSESNSRRLPLCPVASFHLQNGAILRRINWKADLSTKGIRNSLGIMVNYAYILTDMESNMEQISQGNLHQSFHPSCLV